jgi:hypothetical protein
MDRQRPGGQKARPRCKQRSTVLDRSSSPSDDLSHGSSDQGPIHAYIDGLQLAALGIHSTGLYQARCSMAGRVIDWPARLRGSETRSYPGSH